MSIDRATDTVARLFGELEALRDDERTAALSKVRESHPKLTLQLRQLLDVLALPSVGISGYLAGDTAPAEAPTEAAALPAGMRIGCYEIIDELGRGGMGVVYRGRRVDGIIEQEVAIKIARLAAGTAAFGLQREAALVSTLRHPGIAQFHGVEALADGRLALVMELVRGTTAELWCTQAKPSLSQLLAVLLQVAQSAQFAHDRRVTHGDIKPANVLVNPEGQVRLLDFGIAVLMGEADAAHALGVSGKYSAPEILAQGQINLSSDVFSLGVMGGELLAMLKNQSGQNQHGRYSRFRDLELVLQRAAQVDPTKRHTDMGALISDFNSITEAGPVSPRNTERGYRALRLLQRRPALMSMAALLVLSLLAGVIGIGLANRNTQQRADALEKVAQFQASQLSDIDPGTMGMALRSSLLAKRREVLERSESAAQGVGAQSTGAQGVAEQSTAEQNTAKQLANFEQGLDGINFTDVALQSLQVHIFDRALLAIEAQFAQQLPLKARLLQSVADSLRALGLFERAMQPQQQAWQLRAAVLGAEHRDTLDSRNSLGNLLSARGGFAEAEQVLRGVLEARRRTLGMEHPDTLDSMMSLSTVLRTRGNRTEAEPLIRDMLERCRRVRGVASKKTLEAMQELIYLLQSNDQLPEAEAYARELVELGRSEFGEMGLTTLVYKRTLGSILMERGRFDEARPLLTSTLEAYRQLLGNEHATTLGSIGRLCSLNMQQNHLIDAETLCQEAYDTTRRILGNAHSQTLHTLNSIASLRYRQGNMEQAIADSREGVRISQASLGSLHNDSLTQMINLGNLLRQSMRYPESESVLDEAVTRTRIGLTKGHRNIGFALMSHARTLAKIGKFKTAEAEMLEAYEIVSIAAGPDAILTLETIKGFAGIYDLWELAEPNQGYAAKAAQWRQKLPAGYETDGIRR